MERKPILSCPLLSEPACTVGPQCVLCHLLTFCHPGASMTKHRNDMHACQTTESLHLSFPRQILYKRILFTRAIFLPVFEKSPSMSKIWDIKQYQTVCRLSDVLSLTYFPKPSSIWQAACVSLLLLLVLPLPWKVMAPWWQLLGRSRVWKLQGGHLAHFTHMW